MLSKLRGGRAPVAHSLVRPVRAGHGAGIDARAGVDTFAARGPAEPAPAELAGEPVVLTADERRRVLDEWATGVELPEVPGIADMVRRARMIPGIRTAIRCGTVRLTYSDFFTLLDMPAVGSASANASIDRLVRLVALLAEGATAVAGVAPETAVLTGSALGVAVEDRRTIAAERRYRESDRAWGCADVRLLAAGWSDAQLAVELLAALADGATAVVATPSQWGDPNTVVELIATHAVTHVTADVTAVERIAATGAELPTVRRWDVTGVCPGPLRPGRLAAQSPASIATFGYTASAYAGTVTRGSLDGTGRTRPISGARVLVLDEARRPVPPGVVGEVYVGGAALGAEGGNPSAPDRFVNDPFLPEGRLFRTGDRACWTADGWLVCACCARRS
ncbi:AMP-binding protein [Nocardia sp. CY41]|uniref:AMP-binding protein n=1 Tax=Nocardia sp. CY41 TaxID=2608686 RepID=UPI001357562D|nr:AMP-binding protein [Nocardia sp. CY41]